MKFHILTAITSAIAVTRCVFAAPATQTSSESAAAATSTKPYLPQVSPIFPPMANATDVVTSYNAGPYNVSAALPTYQLTGYPEVWQVPNVTHPEVVAAIKQINWDLVPKGNIESEQEESPINTHI